MADPESTSYPSPRGGDAGRAGLPSSTGSPTSSSPSNMQPPTPGAATPTPTSAAPSTNHHVPKDPVELRRRAEAAYEREHLAEQQYQRQLQREYENSFNNNTARINHLGRAFSAYHREASATFSVVEGRESRAFKSTNARMGSEKYKLKWSKYESNILSAFHGLLESENLSDVTLFCEGQTFKAHRLVLAACSTHFESLFNQTPVNAPLNNQFFVILDGTRADDLQILLHFMYRGEAYLHQDRINSVLRTAEVLQVKGLSERPCNIEINQNLHHERANARSWSPTMSNPEASPRHKKNESPLLRRPSSPLMHGGAGGISPAHSYPPVPGVREPFPMFGSLRNMGFSNRGREEHHYNNSPPHGRKSPPPTSVSQRSTAYSSAKFLAPSPPLHGSAETKEERNPTPITASSAATSNDHYEIRSNHSRSGGGTADQPDRSPAHSNKTDYDRRSSPASSLPSPHAKGQGQGSAAFPSDSTTDPIAGTSGLLRSSLYGKDDQRGRRSSDPGGNMDVDGPPPSGSPPDDRVRDKYDEFRRSRDDLARIASRSPNGRVTDLRMTDEEVRNQVAANNLETFRRLAQAHVDREQLLPRGVLGRGIGQVPLTPGLTASDYMRFAMPVRETDNGDQISGSGTKLKCPFCERTYGYETNLRAHIRQRHQGIRVSCPYCPRTFTRNNTVRRHVQREHRNLVGRLPTKFGSTRVMPDPITSVAAAVAVAHHARALSPPPDLESKTSSSSQHP